MSTQLSPEGKTLYLTPKMGLVPEVSAQTYETLAKQFREVVTNSVDAGAEDVKISINTSNGRTYVLVTDDGDGMSVKDLREQFLALGGSQRYYDSTRIGRIGIGFLAVAPICEYVDIYSRKRGSKEAFHAKLWLSKLVDRHFRMEEIKDFPVGELVEIVPDADAKGLEDNYTKLYLQNVTAPVAETFADEKKFALFERELRTILPLDYPEKCPLFEVISPKLRDMLIGEASKNRANVYLNSEKKMVRRVYGEEKGENFGHVVEVKGHEVAGVNVIGYLIDNQAKIRKWNGLVTRVLNVAVEDSGFLGYEEHQSARPRVTGEFHLVGIDKRSAISINRNRFNEANWQYREVQTYIHKRLRSFFESAYGRTRLTSEINKRIRQIRLIPAVLESAESALQKLGVEGRALNEERLQKPIANARPVDLLKVNLGEKYKEKATIEIVPQLEPQWSKKGYRIEWGGEPGIEARVFIAKDVFDPAKAIITLDGEGYRVHFVRAGKFDKPCEIDFHSRVVTFNDASPLVSQKEENLLLFLLIVTYCYETATSRQGLYASLLNALLNAYS